MAGYCLCGLEAAAALQGVFGALWVLSVSDYLGQFAEQRYNDFPQIALSP